MKIVVIGGTGLVGSKVVEKLKQQGNEAVAAAPNTGVDTITGEGLAEALAGAEVVVDVSNSPSFEDRAAMDFFQRSGRNLSAAEQNAGVRHHVALSVVGTDRLQGSGYFRAKLAQEQLIKASAVPYTLIHATQFFEFVGGIAQSATEGETVRLPAAMMQPIVSDDVVSVLAEIAVGQPANGTVEVGGPERLRFDAFIGRAIGNNDKREVVADPHARYYGTELGEESLVPIGKAHVGLTPFDAWSARASASVRPSAKV